MFTLRNIGGVDAVSAINACFADDSVLFKHECAYCLGQMQDLSAVPMLINVLNDENQDVMVRHEAGEALGALGTDECFDALKAHEHSPRPEIRETCEIALDRIRWKRTGEAEASQNPYQSVDPAPPAAPRTTAELRADLLDTSKSLFDRYRALFALRNRGDTESVEAIVAGFVDSSALFRHELAYVLGQMQHPAAFDGLRERLKDGGENEMVRHESAEALGSIATAECLPILHEFAADSKRVVKESCVVALDMHEYENSGSFQYADGVARVATDTA